jgi:hypothetical protein
VKDDLFDGDVEHRLRRAAKRLRAASLDAQARDWTAERPDRIGFARLGQAHYEVGAAADRYGSSLPTHDGRTGVIALLAWAGTTVLILLLVDRPAAPLALTAAIVAGAFAAHAALAAVDGVRRWRALREPVGPAPIDDPGLYTDLTRRLEACAAAARADPSEQHRAAAGDLGQALDWLSAARE